MEESVPSLWLILEEQMKFGYLQARSLAIGLRLRHHITVWCVSLCSPSVFSHWENTPETTKGESRMSVAPSRLSQLIKHMRLAECTDSLSRVQTRLEWRPAVNPRGWIVCSVLLFLRKADLQPVMGPTEEMLPFSESWAANTEKADLI